MKQIKVACLGDSLTNGKMSYNWIKQLRKEMKNVCFYNFGKDGDLAFNGLERIEKVIAAEPDYIFVLFGTNDINASVNEENIDYYRKNKNLPERPTLPWYLKCMQEIISQLKSKTKAKIVIISIPIL